MAEQIHSIYQNVRTVRRKYTMHKFIHKTPQQVGFLTVILNILAGLTQLSPRETIAHWMRAAANRLSPEKKPYRGFAPLLPDLETAPYHPALVVALGNNKALILHKIWEWQEKNRRDRTNLRNGHHWTYDTYEAWQQRNFSWLSVDGLRKLICELERDGLLISGQFTKGSAMKWYRVDVQAVAKLIRMGGQDVRMGGSKSRTSGEVDRIKTKKESTNKKQQIKTPKSLTATTQPDERDISTEIDLDTDVAVVVPHPTPSRGEESGEYSIDGEAVMAKHDEHHGEPFAVEATTKTATPHTTSLSKVPQKVLSPAAAELLDDLIWFKVLPHVAARLIQQHGEEDTRYVLTHAQRVGTLGAGFVVQELDTRKWGVLALRDMPVVQKFVHQSSAATLDVEAMERETARMEAIEAEERARATGQMSDSTGHLQTLISNQPLEYA